MESLQDLLSNRKPEEPEEVTIIKEFLRQQLNATAGVMVGPHQIVIAVKGASLAGALRPRLYALKQICGTTKRIIIRIV